MFGQTDAEYEQDAKEVARLTTDDSTLQKYIEGEVFRMGKNFQQEDNQ